MNRLRARPWVRMVLLATLAVLVSALVFVVWVLPGLLDDKLTTLAPTGEFESPPSTAPAAPSPGQLQQARDKREAERLLRLERGQEAVHFGLLGYIDAGIGIRDNEAVHAYHHRLARRFGQPKRLHVNIRRLLIVLDE